MPLYEFQCETCGNIFDVLQVKYHDNKIDTTCPKCKKCGGKTRRLFSAPLVTYSGSGFYCTDSKADSKPVESAKSSDGGSLVE